MLATPCPCIAKPKPRRSFAAVLVAVLVLVALPKCPLCFVGYAAVLGVSLSVPVASALRIAIIAACVAVLVVAVIRALCSRRA